MMNNFMIVGRLISHQPEPTYGAGTEILTINCPSVNGEDNLFDVVVRGTMANNVLEYCLQGDVLGVKGKLESYKYTSGKKKFRRTILVADKISFLSSKSRPDEEVDLDVDSEE